MTEDMTINELNRATAAVFIAIGASMPKELSDRISENILLIAEPMAEDGDERTADICRSYARAISQAHEGDVETTH